MSEKTLAENVHYIPKGLRKGTPFMDLLLNSHVYFASKDLHHEKPHYTNPSQTFHYKIL